MKGLLKEFKTFAVKGNVVDLAIGVIIGTAFGKIVTSLVNDIVMPLIGLIVGRVNFTNLKLTLFKPGLTLNYGNFIQSVIDFVIVAFSIFIVVKGINEFRKRIEKQKEEAPAPAKPTRTELLLEEIRDLLKNK